MHPPRGSWLGRRRRDAPRLSGSSFFSEGADGESSGRSSRIPSPSWSGCKPWMPSRSLHGPMLLSDLSLNGGMVLEEALSLSPLGSNLHVFTMAELRAVTRDFSIYKC